MSIKDDINVCEHANCQEQGLMYHYPSRGYYCITHFKLKVRIHERFTAR